jgi:hypothetical protein
LKGSTHFFQCFVFVAQICVGHPQVECDFGLHRLGQATVCFEFGEDTDSLFDLKIFEVLDGFIELGISPGDWLCQ